MKAAKIYTAWDLTDNTPFYASFNEDEVVEMSDMHAAETNHEMVTFAVEVESPWDTFVRHQD